MTSADAGTDSLKHHGLDIVADVPFNARNPSPDERDEAGQIRRKLGNTQQGDTPSLDATRAVTLVQARTV